jgi:tetratricopeptide (TPR) repeat protein
MVMSNLGRREEALTAITEAVETYRQLARANSAAFEPDLAMALNNHAAALRTLGREQEAASAAEEATSLSRHPRA